MTASFSRLQAIWINRTTIAIPRAYWQTNWNYALAWSATASLEMSRGTVSGATNLSLTPRASGLSAAETKLFPQLRDYAVFDLPADVSIETLAASLQSQVAVTAIDPSGALQYLTGIQAGGVLDDLFAYSGRLGAEYSESGITIRLWAPTAQAVNVLLFMDGADEAPAETVAMSAQQGVWSASIPAVWRGRYYLYDLRVYVPASCAIVQNCITDPYSADLALNGTKTRLTDLGDPATKPAGWDASVSPVLASPSDFSVYETHVREFSSADETVPAAHRGTYLAFTETGSAGMQHLRQLAQAGLTAVHLLPTFHFGSVNEDRAAWQMPSGLSRTPPDGTAQQAAISAVKDNDAYNWGYDPVHYFAPQGSYASNPAQRVFEYRQMVEALHGIGLRVVQDVVFNHTLASGQANNSVLDKAVPNYYYRLDADGNVYTASCCPDTASERRMMEKLMVDCLVENARQYKIDGFRFDLMGFHFVDNLLAIKQALAALTPANDGVDGSQIYLYGEGWETGETAHNALGLNCSQGNMYSTGIGTFNDRIRDAIRGGGPFADVRLQGFATGLFTAPNSYTSQTQSLGDQLNLFLAQADWLRVSLTGSLRDFVFTDARGRQTKGGDVVYNGQPAGYTAAPIEAVNYCSVHDNQTLFDAIQLKAALPGTTPAGGDAVAVRVRRQVLAISLIMLAQGVPFFLAGDDLLRSKSMDHNSYNSGDWFNQIDWTGETSNWGTGLPIANENQSSWPLMQPLLANGELAPSAADMAACSAAFRLFLQIRSSSRLFRMATLGEVQNNLQFLNTGPAQIPGLIAMKLTANGGDYGRYQNILVVFNAASQTLSFCDDRLKGLNLRLHPLQAEFGDAATSAHFDASAGIASVGPITTAVFVDA